MLKEPERQAIEIPISIPGLRELPLLPVEECFYTPLGSDAATNERASRYLEGYNFFADLGIEAASNTIACCLTAYNEPLEAYRLSLSALAECAEYFRLRGEERVSREFVICILVDGLENMSADFAQYAESIGLYNPGQLNPEADFHMFESQIERASLLTPLRFRRGARCPDSSVLDGYHVSQRVILFIKKSNRGKLDSHRCFFDMICNFYSSAYFVQIDVGTAPKHDALYHMWKELQHNPNLAATAARSQLPVPEKVSDLLSVWQFCDIAMERIVNWPTEILVGNLSVLPGQLSLTRISSITGRNSSIAGGSDRASNVLHNYYRGLSNLSPFQSNMYLAEDRILGLEMVFQETTKWELGYETEAEATVDSCDSWAELCRQRRRWICSSMACRFSMLAKLPVFFRNSQRNGFERIHKSIAAIYFLIYSIIEWFVPASHLIMQTTLTNIALSLITDPSAEKIIRAAFLFTCIGVVLQIFIAVRGKLNNVTEKIIGVSVIIQTTTMALTSTTIAIFGGGLNSYEWIVASFTGMILGYIGLSCFYSRKLSLNILANIFQYTFSRLPIKAFLMTYSVFNAHNTSWGTKGLDSPSYSENIATRSRYLRFRICATLMFCTSNIVLWLAFQYADLLQNPYSIIGMLSIILIQIAAASVAVTRHHLWKPEDKPL